MDRDRHDAPWSRARRALRWACIALALVVPSFAWGLTTASAEASLGPHLARYEVTLDHEITVDLGPLGTLVVDSPLPLVLGARVVVQEIPSGFTGLDAASTVTALGSDLESYVRFFGAPQATLDDAVRALVLDAVRRGVLGTLVLAAAVAGARAVLGPSRRSEIGVTLARHRATIAAGSALVVVVAATLTASDEATAPSADTRLVSSVFDGTPLEGARLTGRLAGVIDTYGGYAVDAYRANEAFYDGAVSALDTAWAERARVEDAAALAQKAHDLLTTPDPTTPPTTQATDPDGEGNDAAAPSGSPGPTDGEAAPGAPPAQEQGAEGPVQGADLVDPVDPVVIVLVSDLHCNVGMARIITELVTLSAATVVLNAGDTTIDGTAVESYCVRAFADAVPSSATLVVADGNHDSSQTSAQEQRAGEHVLDGTPIDVGGLRILGDSDPNATRIGGGTQLAGDESANEVGDRLADVACSDGEGVDILLVHTPAVGDAALRRGCVPAQLSGHIHTRTDPMQVGLGIRYISASTAGARLNQPTVGPLSGTAELTVLRFDPEERRLIDRRLVQVTSEGTVAVGPAVRWPTVDVPPVETGDAPVAR
ncbi:MAG: metallophosphoesterase [Cellulomonadaceae bacterium]|nr:metallophosphoesterase [Cellulomonadaceae bacterium]